MKTLQAVALALTLATTSAPAQVALDESKPPPKSAQPAKPADAKKAPAPKKASAPVATGNPNVKIYKVGDPGAPKLRDRDGKVIPTSPDAYDISSATKK